MLEVILVSVVVAGSVSALVHLASSYQARARVRHLEMHLADLAEEILREKRKRAAAISVSRRERPTLSDEDQAAIHALRAAPPEEEEPWWGKFVKEKA